MRHVAEDAPRLRCFSPSVFAAKDAHTLRPTRASSPAYCYRRAVCLRCRNISITVPNAVPARKIVANFILTLVENYFDNMLFRRFSVDAGSGYADFAIY